MEKIIEIDLCEKDDLLGRYSNENVSRDLIEYLIEESILIDKKDTIKVVINNGCDVSNDDCYRLIKGGLRREYQKSLKYRKLNNFKQVTLFFIGLLFLFISTIISGNKIFGEVFLIIGWVPIWELAEIELFTDVNEKRKRKNIRRLLKSEFEVESKKKENK